MKIGGENVKKIVLIGLFLVVVSFIVFSGDGVQLSDRHDTSDHLIDAPMISNFLVKATEHENSNLGDYQYQTMVVMDPEPIINTTIEGNSTHVLFEFGANLGHKPTVTRMYSVVEVHNNTGKTSDFYINDIWCAEVTGFNSTLTRTKLKYIEYSQECVDSIGIGLNEFYRIHYNTWNGENPYTQGGAGLDAMPVIVGTHYL